MVEMDRHQKITRAAFWGIVLNLVLVGIKGVIGVASGSVAVLTDAVNNLTDTLSAVVTLVGTKLAQKKPDREHPHGHGRIEYIAAILVGLIIFAVGIEAITVSVPLMMHPKAANYSVWGIALIFVTILLKVGFGRYLQRVGKETKSRGLMATGVDAMFDAMLTCGTLVGAITSKVWGVSVEGWVGVVIAAFIIRSAVEIVMGGVEDLIGKKTDTSFARKIRAEIMKYPEVKKVKTLTLHDYGPNNFVGAVKIEVGAKMEMKEFQELAERIEGAMKEEFNVELIVGVA